MRRNLRALCAVLLALLLYAPVAASPRDPRKDEKDWSFAGWLRDAVAMVFARTAGGPDIDPAGPVSNAEGSGSSVPPSGQSNSDGGPGIDPAG